jgi:hypothetical protein
MQHDRAVPLGLASLRASSTAKLDGDTVLQVKGKQPFVWLNDRHVHHSGSMRKVDGTAVLADCFRPRSAASWFLSRLWRGRAAALLAPCVVDGTICVRLARLFAGPHSARYRLDGLNISDNRSGSRASVNAALGAPLLLQVLAATALGGSAPGLSGGAILAFLIGAMGAHSSIGQAESCRSRRQCAARQNPKCVELRDGDATTLG